MLGGGRRGTNATRKSPQPAPPIPSLPLVSYCRLRRPHVATAPRRSDLCLTAMSPPSICYGPRLPYEAFFPSHIPKKKLSPNTHLFLINNPPYINLALGKPVPYPQRHIRPSILPEESRELFPPFVSLPTSSCPSTPRFGLPSAVPHSKLGSSTRTRLPSDPEWTEEKFCTSDRSYRAAAARARSPSCSRSPSATPPHQGTNRSTHQLDTQHSVVYVSARSELRLPTLSPYQAAFPSHSAKTL